MAQREMTRTRRSTTRALGFAWQTVLAVRTRRSGPDR